MTPKPVEFSRFLALLQEQTLRISLRRCRTAKLDIGSDGCCVRTASGRKQFLASLRAAIWGP